MKDFWPTIVFIRLPILALLCFGFWGMGASQGGFMEWLREWQSIIGVIVTTIVAVALFQIQRRLDRNDIIASRKAKTQICLNEIINSARPDFHIRAMRRFENIEATLQTNKDIKSIVIFKDIAKEDFTIFRDTGVREFKIKLAKIERDNFLPQEYLTRINGIEHLCEYWIEDANRVLNEIEQIELDHKDAVKLAKECIRLADNFGRLLATITEHRDHFSPPQKST